MLILHDIIEIPIQYYTKHVCTAEGKRTWAEYEYYYYSSFLSGVLARAIYYLRSKPSTAPKIETKYISHGLLCSTLCRRDLAAQIFVPVCLAYRSVSVG